MPMIRVDRVVKEFRTPKRQPGLLGSVRTLFTRESTVTRAVDEMSFSLEEGELLGYIGPNGAGKSTTIKMLTGILVPSSGEITVAASCRGRSAPATRSTSAWSSGSGASSGGICRWRSRSR